tara:strand:- start:2129 stop:3406 length:1278 start_codon:yes stop_codon:yes gene_type:complete
MSGTVRLANYLKNKNFDKPISIVGSHVQALPLETLKKEKSIDFVFTNEGVYALHNLLKTNIKISDLKNIKGIAFRNIDKIEINEPEKIVPQDKLDYDLPGYAWDLLPFKKKPFDLYRSPLWHAEYDEKFRSPYAAIQTSLGCMFGCDFCMINIINRNDNEEIGVASDYSKMRYWSTDFIIKEFEKLISYGVKTIKITDEMFLLNPKYYVPLCEKLIELNKNDDLKMWAYSRIDTVKKPETLKKVRQAGIKWLCLGIESGDKKVRLEVSKGKFEDVDVRKIISRIHEADIEVMANYIFGLPGDDINTMQKTLDLSIELCTSGWNAYAAMALPGSFLYKKSLENNYELPTTYEGFSFHSYETVPLSTEHLKAFEILNFRDNAFHKYHSNANFLKRIENKFGLNAKENILNSLQIKLKRKIIEENIKN